MKLRARNNEEYANWIHQVISLIGDELDCGDWLIRHWELEFGAHIRFIYEITEQDPLPVYSWNGFIRFLQ